MRVTCDVGEVTLTNDEGLEVESVEATCQRCGHVTESFGTDEPSILRCLALMREECPLGKWNWYVEGVVKTGALIVVVVVWIALVVLLLYRVLVRAS